MDRIMQSCFLIIAAAAYALASCSPPMATLASGVVQGRTTTVPHAKHNVNIFLGVPYAQVPERFARAEPSCPWAGVLDATSFGPSCPQNFGISPLGPAPELLEDLFNQQHPVEDEDCLHVNVFAPSKKMRGGYPVLVAIPGGGWQVGHNQVNMTAFAAFEDVIAVNFNYRTNAFGFPSSPDIPVTERNLGLYDQRMALEWVQHNIAAFGGDPASVTIWGQSAGAMSADFHLKAYANEESVPFHAAILSSGQSSVGLLALTSPGDQVWAALAQVVGCSDSRTQLQCLQETPWQNLQKAMRENLLSFGPEVDNVTVPSHPARLWRNGEVVKGPLLVGTTAEEGRGLVNQEINMTLFLETYFPSGLVPPEARDAIVSVYEADPKLKTDFDVAAAIYTDYFWQCPQGIHAELATAAGSAVWQYQLNASITELLPAQYSWLGKFHGSESWLLFSDPEVVASGGPRLYSLYKALRVAIGKFVRAPETGPGWPEVGAPEDIAVWGDVGDKQTAGYAAVNRTVVDARCGLYTQLYQAIEGVVG